MSAFIYIEASQRLKLSTHTIYSDDKRVGGHTHRFAQWWEVKSISRALNNQSMGINVKSSEVYLGLSMMGQWRGLVSRTEKSIEGSQWWVNCELIQTCEKYINDLQWWIDGELMQRCEKWIESSQWLICSWLSGAWIITLLVKHEFIKNRRVVDSNPAMDIGRHGPPIHSVAKWVPGIWTGMTSQLTLELFLAARCSRSWI